MKKNVLIILMIGLLIVMPFVLGVPGEFGGSDGEAESVITEIAPDYQPWLEPIFEPASGEIESLLFTLQGSLGSAVIFYILGFYQGRRRRHVTHR
ncbi:energy-coupling factor ABC transporter substrate-binding protein [Vibrio gazogenes]|uniref:Cobalt transport protein CbiN n=2 Tax=Vibrio gazogenes TaxID=687 RepID=A0A1M4UTH9_VIBGA|nr:energy-coupling factor ABC transporter substrate-binding protein [Vibrio gazogenes]ASA57791.1 cobalt ABC transporter substrate-binding protein CbiN [Vibrio gazogenes]USP15682.1 energy-coupling factor ABC transporter substrate-binding protein [Vibrio gazogenes]SHE59989.1 cobalt/nickel transport protein [Vibrio gazogenes DSM 21264] [Vibrio gazogenes DSM 21264 = NBRC 103151]SJN56153.1 Cobalt transport protein CbiN [Vibrio gazogenes]